MSLWEPINRLPEDRQMFLCIKIQELIFEETQTQKGAESSMQLFNCKDGKSIEGETVQHLMTQSFFQTFSV
jgi:hypothetical protein